MMFQSKYHGNMNAELLRSSRRNFHQSSKICQKCMHIIKAWIPRAYNRNDNNKFDRIEHNIAMF